MIYRLALSRIIGTCCVALLPIVVAGCGTHHSAPSSAAIRPPGPRAPAPGQPVRDYPAGLGPIRVVYAAVSVPYRDDDLDTGRFDLYEHDLPSGNTKRLTGPDIPGQTRFGNIVSENVHLSPNGRRLVFEANLPNEPQDLDQFSGANVLGMHLWNMDLATGRIHRFDTAGDGVGFPWQGWSPDGRYYIARRKDGPQLPGGAQAKWSWRMWETRTWRRVPITPRLAHEKNSWINPRAVAVWYAPSPDGKRIAFLTNERHRRLEVKDTRTHRVLLSALAPHATNPVFWTGDGRLVYLARTAPESQAQPIVWSLTVLDSKAGRRLHTQTLATQRKWRGVFLNPRWSRNGRWLVGLNQKEDGYDVALWDAKTYAVRSLPGPRGLPSPDNTTDWVSGIDWAEMPREVAP